MKKREYFYWFDTIPETENSTLKLVGFKEKEGKFYAHTIVVEDLKKEIFYFDKSLLNVDRPNIEKCNYNLEYVKGKRTIQNSIPIDCIKVTIPFACKFDSIYCYAKDTSLLERILFLKKDVKPFNFLYFEHRDSIPDRVTEEEFKTFRVSKYTRSGFELTEKIKYAFIENTKPKEYKLSIYEKIEPLDLNLNKKKDIDYLEKFLGRKDIHILFSVSPNVVLGKKRNIHSFLKVLSKFFNLKDIDFKLLCKRFNTNNPFQIARKLRLLEVIIEISKLTLCPVSLVASGNFSSIHEYLFLKECYERNIIPPDIKKEYVTVPYEGGKVINPVKGMHGPGIYLDFSSLYPSIVVEHSLCILQNYNLDDRIIPSFLEPIIRQRRAFKNNKNLPENKKEKLYVWKILMNSLYGVMAFPGFRFFDMNLAQTITRLGRETLSDAMAFCESNFGELFNIVYADTDSVVLVCKEKISDNDKLTKLAEHVRHSINRKYKAIQIEVEKTFKNILIANKKQYIVLDQNGVFDIRGLPPVKKDTPLIAKQHYLEILALLFEEYEKVFEDENKKDDVLQECVKQHNAFVENIKKETDIEKFVITNKLGKDIEKYGDQSSFLPFVRILKRANSNAKKDSLVRWVKIEGGEVLYEEEKINESEYKLDYDYYINILQSNLRNLFSNCFNFIVNSNSKGKKKIDDQTVIVWICDKCSTRNSTEQPSGECNKCGEFLSLSLLQVQILNQKHLWFLIHKYFDQYNKIPNVIKNALKKGSQFYAKTII